MDSASDFRSLDHSHVNNPDVLDLSDDVHQPRIC